MEIQVNLNGAKAGTVARAIADALGMKCMWLARPSMGFGIGNSPDLHKGLSRSTVVDVCCAAHLDSEGYLIVPDSWSDECFEKLAVIMLRDFDSHVVKMRARVETMAPIEETEPGAENDKATRELLQDPARDNFLNLVDSKRALLCNALGVDDVPIYEDNWNMYLPWFRKDSSEEEREVYLLLIDKMIAYAKSSKRISPVEHSTTNEKYAFRVFLLRLGFVGKDYAGARKILLSKLSGNSAWLNGAPRGGEVSE